MGVPKRRGPPMEWMSTLGAMKKHETRIRLSCEACGQWRDVEVDDMIRQLGSDKASLWDRHPSCEQPGCRGQCFFLASPGSGTPFRPLVSPSAPSLGPLPIEAQMDGWTGRWPD